MVVCRSVGCRWIKVQGRGVCVFSCNVCFVVVFFCCRLACLNLLKTEDLAGSVFDLRALHMYEGVAC